MEALVPFAREDLANVTLLSNVTDRQHESVSAEQWPRDVSVANLPTHACHTENQTLGLTKFRVLG